MDSIARSLAVDLAPVRVNVVHPGATRTELWDEMPAEAPEATWAAIAKGCTTGAVRDPEDVTEAFLYLMKDVNCSGSVIHTSGGSLVM
jgi:NAD(P)-dependent dehydrogenase (short-subunit alcohol dehydrogenase family)